MAKRIVDAVDVGALEVTTWQTSARAAFEHRGTGTGVRHSTTGAGPSSRVRSSHDVDQMPAQQLQPLPCESCSHSTRCAHDAFECRAFTRWQKSGHWKPQHRSRPDAGIAIATPKTVAPQARFALPRAPMPRATRADLFRVFDQRVQSTPTPQRRVRFVKDFSWEREQAERRAQANVSRVTEREKQPATTAASAQGVERRDETGQRTQPRGAAAAIEPPPPLSTRPEIASPAPSCAAVSSSSSSSDFDASRETFYPQPALSFHEATERFARELLTRTLIAAGGERAAAAAALQLNRTHLQALVKKLGVDVPMDPKARGRRYRRSA